MGHSARHPYALGVMPLLWLLAMVVFQATPVSTRTSVYALFMPSIRLGDHRLHSLLLCAAGDGCSLRRPFQSLHW
jgi:hypothetical protein